MNNKISQDWELGPVRPLPNPGFGRGWTQPQNSEAFSLRLSGKAGFLEVNGITCQAFKIYSLKGELLPMTRTLDLMVEGRESVGGKGKCWNPRWEERGGLCPLEHLEILGEQHDIGV